jgi:hypothetical protein
MSRPKVKWYLANRPSISGENCGPPFPVDDTQKQHLLERLTPGILSGVNPVVSSWSSSHLTWRSASVEQICPRVSRIHRPVGATRTLPDGVRVLVPFGADSVACRPSKRLISCGTKSSPKSCRDAKVSAQFGFPSAATSEVIEDVANVFSYLSPWSIVTSPLTPSMKLRSFGYDVRPCLLIR